MANIPALAGYQNANGEIAPAKFSGSDVLTDPNGTPLAGGMSPLGALAGNLQITTNQVDTIFLGPFAYPVGTKELRIAASIGTENAAHQQQQAHLVIPISTGLATGYRCGSSNLGNVNDVSFNGVNPVMLPLGGISNDVGAYSRITAYSSSSITIALTHGLTVGVILTAGVLVEAWG